MRGNFFGLVFRILFLSLILLRADQAFCFDTNVAHPGIVNEAVNTYNRNFDPDIPEGNKEKMMSGARAEDTPWRWMNHFYDPINNVGLGGKYLSARDWSEDSKQQRNLALGDKSWQRAVDDWKKGDTDLALSELGHTLHLVADMAVPAHTRLDIHPTGDSFEQFAKNNWNALESIVKKEVAVKEVSKLSESFEGLAKFSNENFYSDDTIESKKYTILDDTESSIVDFGNNQKFKIFTRNDKNVLINLYLQKIPYVWNLGEGEKLVKHSSILTSYSSHLIPEAISYSAGVIKLFFSEVGKDDPEVKPLATSRQSVKGVLNYATGQVVQEAENIYDKVKGATRVVLGEKISNESAVQKSVQEVVPVQDYSAQPITSPVPQIILPQTSNTVSAPSSGGASSASSIVTPIINAVVTTTPTPPSTTTLDISPTSTPTVSTTSTTSTPEITPTSTPQTVTTTPQVDTVSPFPPTPDSIFVPVFFTTSSVVNVFGTATTDTVRVSLDIPLDIVYGTSTNQWSFTYQFTTTSERKIIYVFAYDEAGNTSTPAEVVLVRDLNVPTVPLITAEDISSPTSTRIHVTVTSTDEFAREISFDIAYATSSTVPVWHDWISGSTSTSFDFLADSGSTYFFRAQSSDQFANMSIWSEAVSTTLDWNKRVVINEIAWMGTSPSVNNINDEWLELYNNTTETIDLSGWGIYLNDMRLNWSLRNTQIAPHEYFLIERTDDSTVYEVEADAFITIPSGLANAGAKLELRDASSTTVDMVNCRVGGWHAGATANDKFRTMARINSLGSGGVKSNWRTSDFGAAIGRAQGGGYIYGTPRAPNIGYGLIPNDFWAVYTHFVTSSEFTLRKELSPYVLYGDAVIAAGKKLIVEPGVEIYGQTNGASLIVKGTVEFNGTENNHILVSSRYDRTPGAWRWFGVSATETPAAGDWSRIAIEPGGKVKMNYTDLRYGGALFTLQSGWVYGWKDLSQTLRNIGGELTIENSSVSDSFVPANDADEREYSAFVWTENRTTFSASTTINHSNFARGYIAAKSLYNGGYSSEATMRISDSVFESFTHSDGPLQTLRANMVLSNNQFINSAFSGMHFDRFTATTDTVWHAGNYHISNGVVVPAGKKLTIEAGANLQMKEYAGFEVSGILNIWGDSNNRVNVDCMGGTCYWSNINFLGGGTGNLRQVDLVHGNFTGSSGDRSGVIKAVDAQVELDDVKILNAYRPYNAVYLKNSNTVVKNSVLSWDTDYTTNVRTISGIAIDAGNLFLENTIFNRMDYGLMTINSPAITLVNQPDALFQNMKMGKWFPPAFVFASDALDDMVSGLDEEEEPVVEILVIEGLDIGEPEERTDPICLEVEDEITDSVEPLDPLGPSGESTETTPTLEITEATETSELAPTLEKE